MSEGLPIAEDHEPRDSKLDHTETTDSLEEDDGAEVKDSSSLPDDQEKPTDGVIEPNKLLDAPTPEIAEEPVTTVPYTSDSEALSAMQEQRQALGLQPKIEDDPRWQSAYAAAHKSPVPGPDFGFSTAYDDMRAKDKERQIAEARRNDLAARAAADEALHAEDLLLLKATSATDNTRLR